MSPRSPRAGVALLVVLIAGCGQGSGLSGPSGVSSPSLDPTQAIAATRGVTPGPTYPADVLDRPDFAPLESATYFIEPDAVPLRVLYTVPADGWVSWIGTFKPEQTEGKGYRFVGVSIANVTNLVRDGCTDHGAADPPVGPTVDDLATALAALPPFVVTEPPRAVSFDGYPGKHLELTVPDIPVQIVGGDSYFPECIDMELKSWIGRPLSYAFYGYTEPGQKEEFWILDVDGSRLVIEANWSPDSPSADIAELRTILDSIEIEARP